jgi:PAT family beta-lactamase induction signal transducer AmpG
LIDAMGYVNFYLLTTIAAVPGIVLFWIMMRTGLIDASIGTAGTQGSGDARADHPDEEPARS